MHKEETRLINVALYGSNGHQIHNSLVAHPFARLVAAAEFPQGELPASLRDDGNIRYYQSLDQLLKDPRVDLVSLCSPKRSNQARDAIRALLAGKHVFAEKPCAMDEADLDEILRVSKQTGRFFREMADTAFQQPYYAMRRIVLQGRIGRVIQVVAGKSYPYHEKRPQDEEVDGGLIEQCAIHAIRFIEHVASVRIQSIHSMETSAGNPLEGGGLRMAACLMMSLEGGGLASVSANYLNPRGTCTWGYETLRIFGSLGMVESTRGGTLTRLVIGDTDHGALDTSVPGLNYLDSYLKTILGEGEMPLTLQEELSPTRWVIRAKRALLP